MVSTTPATRSNGHALFERALAIPEELRTIARWVVWRSEPRAGDDKPTKVPYNPLTRAKASSTDPRTWCSFEAASTAEPDWSGIGFVLSDTDSITGIDLDHCRDPHTGDIASWAERIIRDVNSYTEVSPTGTGIHIFVHAALPKDGSKFGPIELYETKRYLTVTGVHVKGTPLTVEERTEAVATFHAQTKADYVLIGNLTKNDKSKALWQGDTSSHDGNESVADMALVSYIAKHTRDPAQVDRVFRRSGLMRLKWDEPRGSSTWGMRTIEKVLNSPPTPRSLEPSDYHYTDSGNALRLLDLANGDVRYVAKWGAWLVWNGRYWEQDQTGMVYRLAQQAITAMFTEAAGMDSDRRQALIRWASQSEQATRIRAMLEVAQYDARVVLRTDELDAKPWLLTVANGTLDLRTGTLQPHQREDLITKVVDVPYDPAARAPRWEAFLARAMDNNPKLAQFLQRAVGYTLTGSTREQCLFFLYGSGSNGKSTFTETLAKLLGPYGRKTPTETLMAKRGGGIPNDVARLVGARMVSANETNQGKHLAESLIKDLTGGDTITARYLHQEFFEFQPAFKLWMYGNHKPIIKGTDNGIWRRIKLVPFEVTIPEAERDHQLMDTLADELPGILAWAIQGCHDWQAYGLAEPPEVRAAIAGYREEMDTLADFFEERCERGLDYKVTSAELYGTYHEWCAQNSERALTKREFGLELANRGHQKKKSNGSIWWHGITLHREWASTGVGAGVLAS